MLGAGPQGGGRSTAGPRSLPWGLPSTFQKPRGLASSGPAAGTARLLPRQGKPGSQAQGQSRGWARTSSGQVQAWLAAAPLCAERPRAPLPADPAEHNRDGTGHRAAQLGSASRAGPGQKGRWSPSAPSSPPPPFCPQSVCPSPHTPSFYPTTCTLFPPFLLPPPFYPLLLPPTPPGVSSQSRFFGGEPLGWRGGQPNTASLTVCLDESEEVMKSIQSLPS